MLTLAKVKFVLNQLANTRMWYPSLHVATVSVQVSHLLKQSATFTSKRLDPITRHSCEYKKKERRRYKMQRSDSIALVYYFVFFLFDLSIELFVSQRIRPTCNSPFHSFFYVCFSFQFILL